MAIEEVVDARTAGQLLGVHINSIKRIPRDELPYFRVFERGDRRYRKSDIERYIRLRSTPMTIEQELLAKHDGRKLDAAADLVLGLMAGDRDTFKAGYSIGNALLSAVKFFQLDVEEVALVADWAAKARHPVVIHTVRGGIGYEFVVRGDATVYSFDWDMLEEDIANNEDALNATKDELKELRAIVPNDARGARELAEVIERLEDTIAEVT